MANPYTTTADVTDAYEALRHIYALFGLPPTANPFVQGDRVDTAALLAAFGR